MALRRWTGGHCGVPDLEHAAGAIVFDGDVLALPHGTGCLFLADAILGVADA